MASIGSVSSSGGAWAAAAESRASAMRQKMFSKVDSDASGSVDATELQSMLDDIGQKTGSTAANSADVMKSLDTSGDGTLSQDELAQGMRSLMPAPSSTMQFAQQRDGASAASSASDASTSASASSDASSDASTDASSAIGQGMPPPPGGPPPGPPPAASARDSSDSTSSASSSSASTDPLDTNGDGTVSAQEQLVGDLKSLVAGADSDSDGKISSTELGAFETKLASAFTEALQAMQAASSSLSSSQSDDSSSSDGGAQSTVSASSSASQAAAQERVAQAYRPPPPERSMADQAAAINAFA